MTKYEWMKPSESDIDDGSPTWRPPAPDLSQGGNCPACKTDEHSYQKACEECDGTGTASVDWDGTSLDCDICDGTGLDEDEWECMCGEEWTA